MVLCPIKLNTQRINRVNIPEPSDPNRPQGVEYLRDVGYIEIVV